MAICLHRTVRLTALLIVALLSTSCGQKGGLVRPEATNSSVGPDQAIVIAGTEASNVFKQPESPAADSP